MVGVVFFDYSEANETLLITSENLNIVREITWSDIDLGTTSDYRVMRIVGQLYDGGFTQTLHLREITSTETDS
jgi:hypothetical protein